ncbi:hypothetical protein FJTKL_05430 [Diaporthe vaccinii]|uniref:Uncharacterized protein n=1 Tax=Diaporthe vaccinii TaxID=105482 RepID=A0ABR4FFT4_9PEZI
MGVATADPEAKGNRRFIAFLIFDLPPTSILSLLPTAKTNNSQISPALSPCLPRLRLFVSPTRDFTFLPTRGKKTTRRPITQTKALFVDSLQLNNTHLFQVTRSSDLIPPPPHIHCHLNCHRLVFD